MVKRGDPARRPALAGPRHGIDGNAFIFIPACRRLPVAPRDHGTASGRGGRPASGSAGVLQAARRSILSAFSLELASTFYFLASIAGPLRADHDNAVGFIKKV
ncbi:hypothetical protein [Burkholderia glumae]|uniref:hypothetical protein n=1 Tax=Burkholderia glumae TaxID=337 RepID=UPI001463FDB1|nr:hypothetical protein [Burkholderia glumae]QJP70855.1 hypothetical protein HJC54_11740 [Burkholderia glumae]